MTDNSGEIETARCGECGQPVPSDSELMLSSLAGADTRVLVERFYETLFEMAPNVRPLFPDDMTEQNSRLGGALVALATYFKTDDPEAMQTLYQSLQTMGWAHKRFTPEPGLEEYETVRVALVRVLVHAGVSPLALAAWNRAYHYAAGVMIATQATAKVSPRRGRSSG